MTQLAMHYPAHLERVKGFVDQALEVTGYDGLLIAGGSLKIVFLDDNSYPFKANPQLKWWAPVTDNPNCWLHYRPGEKPLYIFFRPIDYWHDAAVAPTDYWVDHFDLKLIGGPDEIRDLLPKDLSKTAFVGEDTDTAGGWGVSAVNPQPLIISTIIAPRNQNMNSLACARRRNWAAWATGRPSGHSGLARPSSKFIWPT